MILQAHICVNEIGPKAALKDYFKFVEGLLFQIKCFAPSFVPNLTSEFRKSISKLRKINLEQSITHCAISQYIEKELFFT